MLSLEITYLYSIKQTNMKTNTKTPKTILSNESYVELVSIIEYKPVQSIYPFSKLLTIGVKKSTERFYFRHEIERFIPIKVTTPTYLYKESQLKS
jgi:plasmid rolling circle replication initiator protein Rep